MYPDPLLPVKSSKVKVLQNRWQSIWIRTRCPASDEAYLSLREEINRAIDLAHKNQPIEQSTQKNRLHRPLGPYSRFFVFLNRPTIR